MEHFLHENRWLCMLVALLGLYSVLPLPRSKNVSAHPRRRNRAFCVCVCVLVCAPLPAGRDPTCYQCRAFSWRQIRCLVKKVSRESDAFSHSGLSSSLFVLLSFSQMSGQSKKGQKVCMCGWLALQQCIMVQPAIVMSRIQQFACYNLRHILQRDQNIQLL